MQNVVFRDVKPRGSSDVSEEYIASITRVARMGELGIALAGTSNRSTLYNDSFTLLFISPFKIVIELLYKTKKARV
jgi:hypothetical protein